MYGVVPNRLSMQGIGQRTNGCLPDGCRPVKAISEFTPWDSKLVNSLVMKCLLLLLFLSNLKKVLASYKPAEILLINDSMPMSSNCRVRQVTELRELCTHTKCEDNTKPKWTTSTVKLFTKFEPKTLWEKIKLMIVWFAPSPTNPIWRRNQSGEALDKFPCHECDHCNWIRSITNC